ESTLFVAGGRNFAASPPASERARPAVSYRLYPEFVDVRVVDPATRAAQPAGEAGEIWISGASVSGASHTAAGASADSQTLLPGPPCSRRFGRPLPLRWSRRTTRVPSKCCSCLRARSRGR